MKRLDKYVDLIGVMGIERTGKLLRLPDQFTTLHDDFLNHKIREMIKRSTELSLSTDNGIVTVKGAIDPEDQEVLLKMIEQVQGVKKVKVDAF